MIDITGVSHGDSLKWNKYKNCFGVQQVSYDKTAPFNEPNFIIAVTGQSNSQGSGGLYNENDISDHPHSRIYGFSSSSNMWITADLRNDSLGNLPGRHFKSTVFAFYFAKRLVEAYPDIRPGIINYGWWGANIAQWAKYTIGHDWYEFNLNRAYNQGWEGQGRIFDTHMINIQSALHQIQYKNVDVMLWHQGESDWDTIGTSYYIDSLKLVILQYRAAFGNDLPIIVGETTASYPANNMSETLTSLNRDSDINTLCVNCQDLQISDSEFGNGDFIHLSSSGHREMGSLYYSGYKEILGNVSAHTAATFPSTRPMTLSLFLSDQPQTVLLSNSTQYKLVVTSSRMEIIDTYTNYSNVEAIFPEIGQIICFQPDANIVLYTMTPEITPLWSSRSSIETGITVPTISLDDRGQLNIVWDDNIIWYA